MSVAIGFSCRCDGTKVGDEVFVVGSSPLLGNWQTNRAVQLYTDSSSFPWWTTKDEDIVKSQMGVEIEFKFLIRESGGGITWEEKLPGNRRLHATDNGIFRASFNVEDFDFIGGQSTAAPSPAYSSPSSISSVEPSPPTKSADPHSFSASWMGKDIRFVRSHSKGSRVGGGSSGGDSGAFVGDELAQGCAQRIFENDTDNSSWRKKLEVAASIIKDLSDSLSPSPSLGGGGRPELGEKISEFDDGLSKNLVKDTYLEDALRRLGVIPCGEDGGHYRPNHHANLSKEIFKRLEKISADFYLRQDMQADEIRLVVRKIHPLLPSFSKAFTLGQPLTRIRDIAHRNDISQDLKQEIKHTIQNKLHRCAGPEDLVATERMLQRFLNDPHSYPHNFIEEFKKFYEELKQFFNATSLTDRLSELLEVCDRETQSSIRRFLDAKVRCDSEQVSIGSLSIALASATELRSIFLQELQEFGSISFEDDRSEKMEDTPWMQQRRLSEIGIEGFVFVQLSRLEMMSMKNERRWEDVLEALSIGVRNIHLSGLCGEECSAVCKELLYHSKIDSLDSSRDAQLFLKATLDRCRRLCEAYGDMMTQLYTTRVRIIGHHFSAPSHSVDVFAEGEIRASVIFQVSKLCSLLLKRLRGYLGQSAIDPIVPGRAIGKVSPASSLVSSDLPNPEDGPHILFLRSATGDEEVAKIRESRNVVGIILGHDLPQLSHLGVRARQEDVVFVACQDQEIARKMEEFSGEVVELISDPKGVSVTRATQEQQRSLGASDTKTVPTQRASLGMSVVLPPVRLASEISILDVDQITKENSGSKAANCAELARVAERQSSESRFTSPRTFSLPFGTMELIIKQSGVWDDYCCLVERLDSANAEDEELDTDITKLKDFISQLELPENLYLPLRNLFKKEDRLIVRSSANAEDLEGFSAAGLYDSVPNVNPHFPGTFKKAVLEVWQSLFSRRAVLCRRLAGVRQRDAFMGTLIQELLTPKHSFVLHTVNPLQRDGRNICSPGSKVQTTGFGGSDELYGEVAPGLGEILASGKIRGTPYRFVVNKATGALLMLSFCSFSISMLPAVSQAKKYISNTGEALPYSSMGSESSTSEPLPEFSLVKYAVLDFTRDDFSTDENYRRRVTTSLCRIGKVLEGHFEKPQDIEGAVDVSGTIWLFQTRPQP